VRPRRNSDTPPTPIRATLVAAFVRRAADVCTRESAAGPESVAALFENWERILDFRAGPRFPNPDGRGIGRVIGLGPAAQLLFGGPPPVPAYDPKYIGRVLGRVKRALGLTHREGEALKLLEELRADQILWDFRSGSALRKWVSEDPEHRKKIVESTARSARRESNSVIDPRTARGSERGPREASTGEDWNSPAARERRRRESEEERKKFQATFGARRPKEFWHLAVRRLRSELGLSPAEITALARELRPWWGASDAAVAKAIISAPPTPRRSVAKPSDQEKRRRIGR
jgi:hypothetical protein